MPQFKKLDARSIQKEASASNITFLAIDTSILRRHHFNLSSGLLGALASPNPHSLQLVLTSTVLDEALDHMVTNAERTYRELRSSLGQALNQWDVTAPTRDEIMKLATNVVSPKDSQVHRLTDFTKRTGCITLIDHIRVSMEEVLRKYVDKKAPFF